jgi:hypothetical protein
MFIITFIVGSILLKRVEDSVQITFLFVMFFFFVREKHMISASVVLAFLLYNIYDLVLHMCIVLCVLVFGSKIIVMAPGILSSMSRDGYDYWIVFICLALACMFYVAYLPNVAANTFIFIGC